MREVLGKKFLGLMKLLQVLKKDQRFIKSVNAVFFIYLSYTFASNVIENKSDRVKKIEGYHLRYMATMLIEFHNKCGFLPNDLSELTNKDLCPKMSLDYWDFVDVFARPVFYKKTGKNFYLAYYLNTTFYKRTDILKDTPAPLKVDLITGKIIDYKDPKALLSLSSVQLVHRLEALYGQDKE